MGAESDKTIPLSMRPLLLTFVLGALLSSTTQAQSTADPGWAAHAVWYQIFPERFRNGDPTNDPTRDSLENPGGVPDSWRISPWTGDWYARDTWETEEDHGPSPDDTPNFYHHGVFDRRYGGDLQGVIDKLDYLKQLGVNAIYLNPVFYAPSLHKYDGSALNHVDPYFGPDPKGDLALMASGERASRDMALDCRRPPLSQAGGRGAQARIPCSTGRRLQSHRSRLLRFSRPEREAAGLRLHRLV